jgi:hypothetical protein
MVRNQIITSSVSAELGHSIHGTLNGARLRIRGLPIGLPENIRSFLLLLATVTLACIGLASYVSISVEIFETKQLIQRLEGQYQAAERQNSELIWAITGYTSLAEVEQRALALGYEVAQTRFYVPSSEAPFAAYEESVGAQLSESAAEILPAAPSRSPIMAWVEHIHQQLLALAD